MMNLEIHESKYDIWKDRWRQTNKQTNKRLFTNLLLLSIISLSTQIAFAFEIMFLPHFLLLLYNESFSLLIEWITVPLPISVVWWRPFLTLHPESHLVGRRGLIRRRRNILPVSMYPRQNCCHASHIWPAARCAGCRVVYWVHTRS